MKFEAITIKDIAKALHLSVSTVSKALRGSHEISEETKKHVLAYANEHNYKPNPIAQSLKRGLSKSIGVIVCNIDNNFFSAVINGIESVARQKDYNVIITQSQESYEREIANSEHLSSRSVDGLIISLSAETKRVDHLIKLHDKGLPMVFFDRITDEIATHKVIADNFKGAYEGTRHLVQQGFRRIAHITSSSSLSITLERLEGYKKALADAGLTFEEKYIKLCPHGGMIKEETQQALTELLQMKDRPDAIFTASDRLSTTTLSLLRKMQIEVPQQIALVGFTNSISADIFHPSLTAVVQPALEMGQLATDLLIQLIEAKRPVTEFQKRVLDTELQIRDSSLRAK
ncbi:LacI family DNA-binding transcriptional regulator [Puia dinghuensis]|uniref:LacI family transcriptional regulator n=1 Tax=Puia dinghuensis TaxID=1792502 RepID=A0A8J2UCP5_9BACT|nr:LacI family DNA-binding transcriptional regulator [Puia dinghuensis]GGA99626.1 LacI family transcriptional regulator [Puia dinghuensis]